MYDYCYYSHMDTINISLPTQLKAQADALIDQDTMPRLAIS